MKEERGPHRANEDLGVNLNSNLYGICFGEKMVKTGGGGGYYFQGQG